MSATATNLEISQCRYTTKQAQCSSVETSPTTQLQRLEAENIQSVMVEHVYSQTQTARPPNSVVLVAAIRLSD